MVRLTILALLVLSAWTLNIELQSQEVLRHTTTTTEEAKHLQTPGSLNPELQSVPLATNFQPFDNQFVVPVKYNGVTYNSVVDSTTYETWLPAYTSCTGEQCPSAKETAFECKSGCTISKVQPTSPTSHSNAGRVAIEYKQANLSKLEIAGLKVSDVHIQLAEKYTAGIKPINYHLSQTGNLGLGYGKTIKDYQESQLNQVLKGIDQPQNGFANDILGELAVQRHAQVSKPSFALKVEDNLSVLSFGETDSYFHSGKFTHFQNQGLKNWALEISSLTIGAAAVANLPPLPPAQHTLENHDVVAEESEEALEAAVENAVGVGQAQSTQPTAADIANSINAGETASSVTGGITGMGVFDTTTQYIWTTYATQKEFQQRFVEDEKQTCDVPTQGAPIYCNCPNQSDANKFKDLHFYFNYVNQPFTVPASDYIHWQDKKCLIRIRSYDPEYDPNKLFAGKPAIVIGHSFLRNNYVSFNQQNNQISIAPSTKVDALPKHIDGTNRIWAIIVGAVLLLAALVGLLAILKQLGYQEPVDAAKVEQIQHHAQQHPQQLQPQYAQQQQYQPQNVGLPQLQQLQQTIQQNPQYTQTVQTVQPILQSLQQVPVIQQRVVPVYGNVVGQLSNSSRFVQQTPQYR